MIKHLPVILIIFFMLFGASACTSSRSWQLSEADNGSALEMNTGETLVITLAGNPTTGYQWELVPSQDSVLQMAGEAEYMPGKTKLVGAGGIYRFTFTAHQPGSTRLNLKYYRSFEPADTPPVSTFSITVTVK